MEEDMLYQGVLQRGMLSHIPMQDNKAYKVSLGYQWQMGRQQKVPWANLVWARTLIPRHAFIAWIFTHHKLPTKVRLRKYMMQPDMQCNICQAAEEDELHLFFSSTYAAEIWQGLQAWWDFPQS